MGNNREKRVKHSWRPSPETHLGLAVSDSVSLVVKEAVGVAEPLADALPLKLFELVDEPLRVRVAVRDKLADFDCVADPLLDIDALWERL